MERPMGGVQLVLQNRQNRHIQYIVYDTGSIAIISKKLLYEASMNHL